jgi:hypothetical protein
MKSVWIRSCDTLELYIPPSRSFFFSGCYTSVYYAYLFFNITIASLHETL